MKDYTVRNVLLAVRIASLAVILTIFVIPAAHADGFTLSSNASSYSVLFEGNQANTLQITNVTISGGNVGVGNTGLATDSGPSTVTGSINFSAANTGQFSNNNGSDIIGGGVNYGVTGVTSALNEVNTLNTTLSGYTGTNLGNINLSGNASMTINASTGNLVNGNEVFDISALNTTNGNTLIINGDGLGHNVVINFVGGSNINFNNQVTLTGGLTASDVIFNFVGGSNLTGGPALQINDNASGSSSNVVEGIFLDPNGAISIVNTNLQGQIFGGDTHDMQVVSGDTINTPRQVPEPASALLLGAGFSAMALWRKRKQ